MSSSNSSEQYSSSSATDQATDWSSSDDLHDSNEMLIEGEDWKPWQNDDELSFSENL